jgi:hypothetical protein
LEGKYIQHFEFNNALQLVVFKHLERQKVIFNFNSISNADEILEDLFSISSLEKFKNSHILVIHSCTLEYHRGRLGLEKVKKAFIESSRSVERFDDSIKCDSQTIEIPMP